MRPETPKLLEDIRDAAAFIVESVSGHTFNDYRENRLLRQAIERNYEIIGEALNRLKRVDSETTEALGDFGRIIAFRNILIHAYDAIDNEIVWFVTKESLPDLLDAVEKILKMAEEQS